MTYQPDQLDTAAHKYSRSKVKTLRGDYGYDQLVDAFKAGWEAKAKHHNENPQECENYQATAE